MSAGCAALNAPNVAPIPESVAPTVVVVDAAVVVLEEGVVAEETGTEENTVVDGEGPLQALTDSTIAAVQSPARTASSVTLLMDSNDPRRTPGLLQPACSLCSHRREPIGLALGKMTHS